MHGGAVGPMSRTRSRSGASGGERELVLLRGRLTHAVVQRGTASEHDSWVLDCPGHGRLALSPLDANPFERAALPAEAGAEVEAEGYLLGSELRYVRVRVL